MTGEPIPDLPDDVGDALYEYRQAIRNVLLDGGKKAVAAETETYAAFVAAFYAALAAERAQAVRVPTVVVDAAWRAAHNGTIIFGEDRRVIDTWVAEQRALTES